MPWVRFEDNFYEKDRIFELSDGAFRLWVSAIAWCNAKLTDGYVPKVRLPTLMPTYRKAFATELVKSGLWIDRGEQYEVEDYLRFQPSADDVRAKQERLSERGKKGANKRWGHGSKHGNKDADEHGPGQCLEPESDAWPMPQVPSPAVEIDVLSVKSEGTGEDSTDDPFLTEAKQRLADELAAGKRIKNPAAYVAKTVKNLHAEGWTPPPEPPAPWTACGVGRCAGKYGPGFVAEGVMCPCHPRFEDYA